jgi:hypothetical protein
MNEPQVRRINRSNGEEELVPVSSAVEKLIAYYALSKEQITEALLSRVPMMSCGYVYTTTTLPAENYRMAADIGEASSGDRRATERFKGLMREAR